MPIDAQDAPRIAKKAAPSLCNCPCRLRGRQIDLEGLASHLVRSGASSVRDSGTVLSDSGISESMNVATANQWRISGGQCDELEHYTKSNR
jgi:hypothetical protein